MAHTVVDPLARYWAKRDFGITAEPRGARAHKQKKSLSFVIQKHAASRLHYDFRLELDGVLISWAVPKGPSYDPLDKRMAIHVEDHPLSYGSFEGTIPPKQYGAGTVAIWDCGTWVPVGDPHDGLAKGKLVFRLQGQKMVGLWELVKIAKGDEKQERWLLFKKRDEFARPKADYDVVQALPDSVVAKPLAPIVASQPAIGKLGVPNTLAQLIPKKSLKSSKPTARGIPGAVKADLPASLSPQLATLAAGVPATGQWVYEIKFDGYRLMTRLDHGKATLITSGGHDWTAKMPGLARELEDFGVKTGWLDGEIVVLGENGLPDFHALQQSFDHHTSCTGIIYFVFDVPFFEGYDLRGVELSTRRQLLKTLFQERGSEHVRFSADFEADPASILSSACQMNLEGVMAKRKDATYTSKRSETWLKLKCKQRQEFVVCGYTDRSDGSVQVGSLMLGVHDASGELVSVGSVGTGWHVAEASALKDKLARLEVPKAPFSSVSKPARWSRQVTGSERWVAPRVVAEVEFAGWTPDGQIRHSSYIALRTDKPATAVTREIVKHFPGSVPPRHEGTGATAGINVTHGERVIDLGTGLTKLDLVRYYESVAQWIVPHLKGRPCSLVRGADGVSGHLFFQTHGEKIGIPGVRELDASLWPGHAGLLVVGTKQALAGAAQMNAIEFHTWNSLATNIDEPNRMIFDLDPGEGTRWQYVLDAAVLVRGFLLELGLECWLKTSGGKGLHVVVPLTAHFEYDTVKLFSRAIVQHLAMTIPSRFVSKSGPANRLGKVFVDYLRNGHGATTAAAFSARARPGLGVSMPISWDELPKLKSGAQWTVATARDHLSFQKSDPWADYWKKKQSLSTAMKALGFDAGKTQS